MLTSLRFKNIEVDVKTGNWDIDFDYGQFRVNLSGQFLNLTTEGMCDMWRAEISSVLQQQELGHLLLLV